MANYRINEIFKIKDGFKKHVPIVEENTDEGQPGSTPVDIPMNIPMEKEEQDGEDSNLFLSIRVFGYILNNIFAFNWETIRWIYPSHFLDLYFQQNLRK